MNERIKELVVEAKVYYNEDVYNDLASLEKFAELIIAECAGKVDWILAEGGKTQGDLIKEHFGVEE